MARLLFMNPDGACAAAQSVLSYLQHMHIEQSWCPIRKIYLAQPLVARWENCREQGYVISMYDGEYLRKVQLNIAFYEHRNSDDIVAIVWEQITMNSPNISTIDTKGAVFKDKWDLSASYRYDESYKMADWIHKTMTEFWVKHNPQEA
jgi:hypothetical protein